MSKLCRGLIKNQSERGEKCGKGEKKEARVHKEEVADMNQFTNMNYKELSELLSSHEACMEMTEKELEQAIKAWQEKRHLRMERILMEMKKSLHKQKIAIRIWIVSAVTQLVILIICTICGVFS